MATQSDKQQKTKFLHVKSARLQRLKEPFPLREKRVAEG
jgi:hypothetical protein